MNVLITGAGGYIGSVATAMALQKGYTVTAIDNFSSGFKQPLEQLQKDFPSKLTTLTIDILNNKDLVSAFGDTQIDAVMHYAGVCSVHESVLDPSKYFSVNTVGTYNVLEAMRINKVENIIFSSTCAVYGQSTETEVLETNPTLPVNPYGGSKLAAETLIQTYAKTYGISFFILRYFNVCGALKDGSIGDSKHPSVHLVQNVVRAALGLDNLQLTYPRVNTPDGSPIRDYINVNDLNLAHFLALERLFDNEQVGEIVNLGTGNGNSVLEIIRHVEEIFNLTIPIETGESRLGEYPKMITSTKKALEILGWKTKHTLEDSIYELKLWYEKHPNGWNY